MTPLAAKHHHCQRVRRLLRKRALRDEQGVCVVEGEKLVREALASGRVPELCLLAPGASESLRADVLEAGGRVHDLAPGVLERIAGTVTPQPVLAVVAQPVVGWSAVPTDVDSALVLLDVRDPGNAGTLVRSAEAAGVGTVVFGAGSVDVCNPKTLRASAGAVFHLPVVSGGTLSEIVEECRARGLRLVGAVARDGATPEAVDLTGPVAVVCGNEAQGLDDEALAVMDHLVTIPVAGRSESLNVGMAGAVLAFELARQRRGA